MPELLLVADAAWTDAGVFHAVIALEEKQLAYEVESVPLPIPEPRKAWFFARSPIAGVPMLVHGEHGITESLAISEYLAETFPTPAHPRLFPADLRVRARARQVMGVLRTSLFALRAARPTASVFVAPRARPEPLAGEAAADAAELLRLASALLAPGRTTLFESWCIADADLGLALMRLLASGDPVPAPLEAYARAQWERPSTRAYLARRPDR